MRGNIPVRYHWRCRSSGYSMAPYLADHLGQVEGRYAVAWSVTAAAIRRAAVSISSSVVVRPTVRRSVVPAGAPMAASTGEDAPWWHAEPADAATPVSSER